MRSKVRHGAQPTPAHASAAPGNGGAEGEPAEEAATDEPSTAAPGEVKAARERRGRARETAPVRRTPPQRQAPRRGGSHRGNQVMIGAVSLLVGASLALSGAWAALNLGTTSTASGTNGSTDQTASSTADASASPSPSESPASAVLEAALPTSVDGVSLVVQSATDATSLGSSPSTRALDAAVVSLGKKSTDLELGVAYDGTGSLGLTILGFRVNGLDVSKLRAAVLASWVSSSTAGVTSTQETVSGLSVTKVSYGDGAEDEFVFVKGDAVFVVETSDEALMKDAIAEMLNPGSTTPSAAPSASAAASASPAS